jgi:hypothetical protein
MKIKVEFDLHANCFWLSPNNKYVLSIIIAKRYLICSWNTHGIFLMNKNYECQI